jgi:NADH-quinone oxidoreductase subunit L
MLTPLFLLAGLSIAGGYIGIPRFLGQHGHGEFHWDVAAISTAVVLLGIGLAWLMYQKRAVSPQQVVQALALPHSFVKRRFYIDELYSWYVKEVQQKVIAGVCDWVEQVIIIGIVVNGTAWLTRGLGHVVRLAQTGKVQTYVLVFLVGVICLLAGLVRL